MIILEWWRRPNFLRVAVGHVGHVGCDPQQSQLSITLANPEKFGTMEVRYLLETRKSCVAYIKTFKKNIQGKREQWKNLRIFWNHYGGFMWMFFSFETQRNLWGSTRQCRAISACFTKCWRLNASWACCSPASHQVDHQPSAIAEPWTLRNKW